MDKTRASRDGHEFHEAWAARKALQLVLPTDSLVGIAVEGLAPADQVTASAETIEIADLVLYYGKRPTFLGSNLVVIVQLKYSKSSQSTPFRASDAKKTIGKFAAAFNGLAKEHGAASVREKLLFELITNRPVYQEFLEAIEGLASNKTLTGEARKQADQLITSCGLKGKKISEFATKLKITGLVGDLRENKQHLSRVVADWSAAPDSMSRSRLGNMRELVRHKAGLASERRNVITRIDVLDALGLQSPEDLFPCPAIFPDVGTVVARDQLSTAVRLIPKLDKPFLIHADGGVGKTVFLQSVSGILGKTHKTVLFDCFGGGAYRAPEDSRHLPKRGLVHIVNILANEGLCDPLLPGDGNVEELVRAFRFRITQAVDTLQRGSPEMQLLLFIDAIDNAIEHANDKGELAFPRLLLESFYHGGAVAGVQLIVSCRTYRRTLSRGEIPCEELKLNAFGPAEVEKYLRDRIPQVSTAQIQVAYARSQGNARILEHLALSDRGLLDPSEINNVITLDDLLKERIRKALSDASKRGYAKPDIDSFLAGLSVLPPPVPIEEYADAHGMDVSAIKSFAADLAPLLEQTSHGLMFRDEPTETLIREAYAANEVTLRRLANNLFRKQGTSVYASKALPGLLQKLNDGKLLFDLAFDERFPATITSTVGKQNIRYTRLKAAVLHSARNKDFNRLVHLLVELSALAAVNQRGTDFVLANPDLVIASHDVDASRRLFETRTNWPGMRHARLTIASSLSDDLSNASRHGVSADEWIRHYFRQDEEYRRERGGPDALDIASIPLSLVAQGRGQEAALYMAGWKDRYAFSVGKHIFTLLRQAEDMKTISVPNILQFLSALKSQPGVLAAALSFRKLNPASRRNLIRDLAKACEEKKVIQVSRRFYGEKEDRIEIGLVKAAAIAVAMNMRAEALSILATIPQERPRLWTFTDRYSNKDAFPFIAYAAVFLAAERRQLTGHSLLPQELVDVGVQVPHGPNVEVFGKALKVALEELFQSQSGVPDEKRSISFETKRDAIRFIDNRLEPLVEVCQAFIAMLSSSHGKGDKSFIKLIEMWTRLRKKSEGYSEDRDSNVFFDQLGHQFLVFLIGVRTDLSAASVDAFAARAIEDGVTSGSTLIELVSVISTRADLQELAGKLALRVKGLIENEDEVDSRASLFANLSRAIMPASFKEAASYFRIGLEQMDAIGSGDYAFTNELLLFAAELRGSELEEADFHTLSNICELNMQGEVEKFPWLAFGNGLARISGLRTLAKIGRWSDRDKISLDYTLLPYLTCLIEQDKIDPAVALALLRISDPVELYVCGTEQLAEVISKKKFANSSALMAEVLLQFTQNHPGVFMPSTLRTLQKLAEFELGRTSEQCVYLSLAVPKFEKLRDEGNENRNYHGVRDEPPADRPYDQESLDRQSMKKIESETDPTDEASISRAIDMLEGMQNAFTLQREFLEGLRNSVSYAEWPKYVQIVARLVNLDIYPKLGELKECKEKWGASSASVESVFRDIAVPLVQAHANDFIYFDHLSGSKLKEISNVSGVQVPVLALELIELFAAPDTHLSASIWMGLATIVCQNTTEGEGQIALKRLLTSNAAKLSSSVADGVWKGGLYPTNNESEIAAGLVWLTLGSPFAANRWRAAHSVRCLARFGKWEVLDLLILKLHSTDAHPFQAPELAFYFLHARLWLLISIARTALDHPQNVAKYADMLTVIALDQNTPHLLCRAFAAQAILVCASKGSLALSEAETTALKAINQSALPPTKAENDSYDWSHQKRPESMPEPNPEFYLDYDFNKSDVSHLSEMFGRPKWETRDALTGWVRKYDPSITSMYETGERIVHQRDRDSGMTARFQSYGQQLGWHALYLVAGEFLEKYPIIQSRYHEDDSWAQWLKRELLTRSDGLWLADGVDRAPVDAQVNLLEKGEKGLVITGDKRKLLGLLNIQSSISQELVVAGDWCSGDGINIRITSALTIPHEAKKLALQLSNEDPFQAWLPRAEDEDGGDEYHGYDKAYCTPWIVWPSTQARLDQMDPLGADSAMRRLRFTKAINSIGSLASSDQFKRTWVDPIGRVAVRSEAWTCNSGDDEGTSAGAERLVCSSDFLREALRSQGADLLVLILLRRYERGGRARESEYFHTTAVIRITESLEIEYYPGVVNKLHVRI